MKADEPERREAQRAFISGEVRYQTEGVSVLASIRNISRGGMVISTDDPLREGEEVQLRFTLPGIARTFNVKARIVWSNPALGESWEPPGMGVEFLDLDEEGARVIDRFIQGPEGG